MEKKPVVTQMTQMKESVKIIQFTQMNKKMISTPIWEKVEMRMITLRTKIVMKTTAPHLLKALTLPPLIARNLIQEAS